MNLPQQTVDFLVENIRKYFPKGSYQIILFGSYSTGMNRETSDIDLAIKGNGPLSTSTWQILDSFFEESYLEQKVDLVDYQRISTDFKKIIDKEGIELDP